MFFSDLTQGPLIYVYEDSVLANQEEYWLLSLEDPTTVRSCQFFSHTGESQEVQYEISSSGVHMASQAFRIVDSAGLSFTPARIYEDDIYPLVELPAGSALVQRIRIYNTADTSAFTEITKNRQYAKLASRNHVQVNGHELFELYDQGYITVKNEFTELYARDTGLISFTKYRDGVAMTALRLSAIHTPTEFRQIYGYDPPCLPSVQ